MKNWFTSKTIEHIVAPLNDIVAQLEKHIQSMNERAIQHRSNANELHAKAADAEREVARGRVVAANIKKLLS